MLKPDIQCDRDLLRESLADRLTDRQEEELARHLTQCGDCQQELERLAGDREVWKRVRQVLVSEENAITPSPDVFITSASASAPFGESPKDGDGGRDGGRDGDGVGDEDDDLLADFVVDFLQPSTDRDALGRLGDVEIQGFIGRGGMGIVLRGFQPELKRLVAVKVMGPQLAVSGPARKRFAREAQAAAAVLHPNVMPILTVHSAGKLPYLVMPYVDCESLEHRIRREGQLDLVDVLRIGMQTASGLAAAHAQGLVHRDVKPANILLEKGVDRVLLTDFGLARSVDDASITRTGVIAGTPEFMSPEQARGEPIDARSDLFSLGSVLYTMAAGRPPFRAESTYGILRRITDTSARALREVNSSVPDWLATIIEKLMAKLPQDRFASAAELAALLERCLAHVQQPAAVALPSAVTALTGKTNRSHRATLMARALIVGLLVVVAIAIAVVARREWRPDASSPSPEPTSKQAAETAVPDPNWQDRDQELRQLLSDGERFERRVPRLWDLEPSASETD